MDDLGTAEYEIPAEFRVQAEKPTENADFASWADTWKDDETEGLTEAEFIWATPADWHARWKQGREDWKVRPIGEHVLAYKLTDDF